MVLAFGSHLAQGLMTGISQKRGGLQLSKVSKAGEGVRRELGLGLRAL